MLDSRSAARGACGRLTTVQLLSITNAAARLDCSRGHIYSLIASGQLRAVEIKPTGSTRSKTRIREEDLDAFIEAHTREL